MLLLCAHALESFARADYTGHTLTRNVWALVGVWSVDCAEAALSILSSMLDKLQPPLRLLSTLQSPTPRAKIGCQTSEYRIMAPCWFIPLVSLVSTRLTALPIRTSRWFIHFFFGGLFSLYFLLWGRVARWFIFSLVVCFLFFGVVSAIFQKCWAREFSCKEFIIAVRKEGFMDTNTTCRRRYRLRAYDS